MLLNREALLVLDTADTSLTSLSDDLADRLSDPRGSLPERCKDNKTHKKNSVFCLNKHTLIKHYVMAGHDLSTNNHGSLFRVATALSSAAEVGL